MLCSRSAGYCYIVKRIGWDAFKPLDGDGSTDLNRNLPEQLQFTLLIIRGNIELPNLHGKIRTIISR